MIFALYGSLDLLFKNDIRKDIFENRFLINQLEAL